MTGLVVKDERERLHDLFLKVLRIADDDQMQALERLLSAFLADRERSSTPSLMRK